MSLNNLRLACLAPLFLIVAIGFGCSSGKAFKSETTYKCDDGKSFVAEFYERVDIAYLGVSGKTYLLHRIPSTSGIRYSDGSTTFWIRGNSAFVETNGRTEFNNCSAKPK